jgi:hypothetical protein
MTDPAAKDDACHQARDQGRAAIEPAIGHIKNEHREGRSYHDHHAAQRDRGKNHDPGREMTLKS